MAISTNNKNETTIKAAAMAKSMSRSPLFYACLLGVLLSVGAAGLWLRFRPSIQRAEQLLEMGAPDEAVSMLSKLADKGDSLAVLRLGTLYYSGKSGVSKNDGKARALLLRAASANHAEAKILLGDMAYREGDYQQAYVYLAPLEHSGNGAALSLLGRMYYYGQGVEKNTERAAGLLQRATESGDWSSDDVLGRMYFDGEGVPRDYEQAEQLLRKVPPGTDNDIDLLLGKLYYFGLDEGRDLPRAAVRLRHADAGNDPQANYLRGMIDFLVPDEAGGNGLAVAGEYLEKALRLGVEEAHYPLAVLYYRGAVGEGPDYAAAMRHLEPALAAGDDKAKALLGEMYYYGRGVAQDFDKAASNLEASVSGKGEDEKYNYLLGLMYYEGQGVKKDFNKAAGHVMYAANHGNPEARVLMATMYYYGRGVARSMDKALTYLEDSVEAEDPAALALRGRMYYYGDGGEWSEDKARDMLRRAAEAGNEEAEDLLRQDETRTRQRMVRSGGKN